MIIKEIVYKNMISHPHKVSLSFLEKMPTNDQDHFFESTIVDKPRSSNSKNAILKTMAFIGKNASYKTSTLMSISKILGFITSFKKNADHFFQHSLNIDDAIEWYENENGINPFEDGINANKIFKEYLKWKKQDVDAAKIKKEYVADFFNKNAFDKDDEIQMKIVFINSKKQEYNVETTIFPNEKNEIFIKTYINNEPLDLYNCKIDDILKFKHSFASFAHYNIYGERVVFSKKRANLFLDSAIQYLFFESFQADKNRLTHFLQILDPTIKDIKYKAFKSKKTLKQLSIQRSIGDLSENIEPQKMSSGTQMFIVYLYYILKYDFLIIDELEQSLHTKLVELLLDIAKEKNKQIIFSTHNPVVLLKLKNYQIHILDLNSMGDLKITKANKIFRGRENLLVKCLKDLVSSIPDSHLDLIKMEFYE